MTLDRYRAAEAGRHQPSATPDPGSLGQAVAIVSLAPIAAALTQQARERIRAEARAAVTARRKRWAERWGVLRWKLFALAAWAALGSGSYLILQLLEKAKEGVHVSLAGFVIALLWVGGTVMTLVSFAQLFRRD